jgi:hypothetical protein
MLVKAKIKEDSFERTGLYPGGSLTNNYNKLQTQN